MCTKHTNIKNTNQRRKKLRQKAILKYNTSIRRRKEAARQFARPPDARMLITQCNISRKEAMTASALLNARMTKPAITDRDHNAARLLQRTIRAHMACVTKPTAITFTCACGDTYEGGSQFCSRTCMWTYC